MTAPKPTGSARRVLRPVRGIMPAALLGALALSCGVALTATSGWLIVAASFRPQILTLLAAIVLVRAFGMARPAFRYLERIRSHDVALAHLAEDRAATYAALVPLTPARLGRRGRGDVLATVVDDLDDLAYAQVRVVVPVVAVLVTGLIAALADALILVPAGLVVLAQIVAALGTGLLGLRWEQRAQAEVVAARARVTQTVSLISGNADAIAAIGAQADIEDRLHTAQSALRAALVRQARGRAASVALMSAVTVAAATVMVLIVQPWVTAGLPTPLAAFLVLTPVALGEVVGQLPDAMGAAARARRAGHRLDRLLGQAPAVTDTSTPTPTPTPAETVGSPGTSTSTDTDPDPDTGIEQTLPPPCPRIGLTEVTASWAPDRPALAPLSLELPPGTTVAVSGPNGSGKSTLLAVLARQLDPERGGYTHDGVDVRTRPLAEVRARIAVVDDEPHVFASSLRENLRLAAPGAGDEQIEAALSAAGLRLWYAGLPAGLDTVLGAGALGVSGGERTRLAIARAILSRRPIVLLDEPVAHLDHPTAVAVLSDLRAATDGTGRRTTTVLVGHRPEGLEDAEVTLVLAAHPAPVDATMEP